LGFIVEQIAEKLTHCEQILLLLCMKRGDFENVVAVVDSYRESLSEGTYSRSDEMFALNAIRQQSETLHNKKPNTKSAVSSPKQ
jgi:hypothetical protein